MKTLPSLPSLVQGFFKKPIDHSGPGHVPTANTSPLSSGGIREPAFKYAGRNIAVALRNAFKTRSDASPTNPSLSGSTRVQGSQAAAAFSPSSPSSPSIAPAENRLADAGQPTDAAASAGPAPSIPTRTSSLENLKQKVERELLDSLDKLKMTATEKLQEVLSQYAGKPGMTVRIGCTITDGYIRDAQENAEKTLRHHLGRLQKAGIPIVDTENSINKWKAHIATVLQQASDQHEWKSMVFRQFIFDRKEMIPIRIELMTVKSHFSSGAFGSVSLLKDRTDCLFIGKSIKPDAAARHKAPQKESKVAPQENRQDHPIGDPLEHEWAAFRKIQEEAGSHENLPYMYGIGCFEGSKDRTLLMDYVPGMSATEISEALRRCLDTKRISHTEYHEAIKFVIGRLLDVIGHIAKAGVVHLDIKPDNIMVNNITGEPVLIDLGLWAASGSRATRGSPTYAAPEAFHRRMPVDARADVFSLGAALVELTQGYRVIEENGKYRRAADGLRKDDRVSKDSRGNAVRRPGFYGAGTAYTRFLAHTLAAIKDAPVGARRGPRPDPAQAKELEYLSDRMLDDDAAKAVLKKAMTIAREEAAKPEGERWKFRTGARSVSPKRYKETKQMLKELRRYPKWEAYADLLHLSRTDPALKRYFDEGGAGALKQTLEKDAVPHALRFIERSQSWAGAARSVVHGRSWSGAVRSAVRSIVRMWLRDTPVESGIDKNGVRRNVAEQRAGDVDEARASRVQKRIAPHVSLDELRAYATEAEVFLLDVGSLGPIGDPRLRASVEKIRKIAQDARHVLALNDAR